MSTADIMRMIAAGESVIFIDARETPEFQEEHLPGALNLTLRQVRSADLDKLNDAKVVVAYCLKDFRGYEVARALKEAGLDNVRTLGVVGLNGWKQSGLPTAGVNSAGELAALEKLRSVARSWNMREETPR